MDTSFDTADEKEMEMSADVERYFSEDIDKLTCQGQDNFPLPVRVAQRKYHALLDLTYAGKNKWRPGAWNTIESKLRDEGLFMYDLSDVTSLCTYALYIEVAVLYLRGGSKRKQYECLHEIVFNDVKRLGAYMSTEYSDDITQGDQDIIGFATTMCRLFLQRLDKEYPDT